MECVLLKACWTAYEALLGLPQDSCQDGITSSLVASYRALGSQVSAVSMETALSCVFHLYLSPSLDQDFLGYSCASPIRWGLLRAQQYLSHQLEAPTREGLYSHP